MNTITAQRQDTEDELLEKLKGERMINSQLNTRIAELENDVLILGGMCADRDEEIARIKGEK